MTSTNARLTLLSALMLAACASEPDDTCVANRRISLNRIALNRIALNRIALNGLHALPTASLTSKGIAQTMTPQILADDLAVDVLEYAVSCALAPEQSVQVATNGGMRTFAGALGLAPQWGTDGGQCDATCRHWISACLIARSNFVGESKPISLLGEHTRLVPTAEESAAFRVEEATYFGDLFAEPLEMYACLPAGASTAERTCGDDTANCPIAVLGKCEEVCDTAGCRRADGVRFAETITVNLPDANASCE